MMAWTTLSIMISVHKACHMMFRLQSRKGGRADWGDEGARPGWGRGSSEIAEEAYFPQADNANRKHA